MKNKLEELCNKLSSKENRELFKANTLFINDLIDNMPWYINEYGLEALYKVLSDDLERLNDRLIMPYSRKDRRIFEELADDIILYIFTQPEAIAYSFKHGLSLHKEEDLEMLRKKRPELLI